MNVFKGFDDNPDANYMRIIIPYKNNNISILFQDVYLEISSGYYNMDYIIHIKSKQTQGILRYFGGSTVFIEAKNKYFCKFNDFFLSHKECFILFFGL